MQIEKEKLEEVVKSSMNRKECFSKLGLHPTSNHSYRTLAYYIRLYDIDTSHFISYGVNSLDSMVSRTKIPLEDILSGLHPQYASSKIRVRLISEGKMEHRCAICDLSEWQDQPIPLDLDHINGNPTDHSFENLRLLCRNCHAQTDNFCGKNHKIVIKKNENKKIKKDTEDLRKQKIQDRINLIIESGVDFSKFGWVVEISKLIGISQQKVSHWMKRHMTQFYEEKCFKRKVAGV